jgi:SAM-dependent methyltransferase
MTVTRAGEFNPGCAGRWPNPIDSSLIREPEARPVKGRAEETTSTAIAYEAFAFLYSRTIAEDFCQRAAPAYKRLLLRELSANSHLLDLCCGTGQWAREFTQLGYRVTGIDASSSMVELARKIAPAAQFFVADARIIAFTHTFSGAISAFNSLAHASNARDLILIFRNVRRALCEASPFVFDISMEEAYASRWCGEFSREVDGLTFTVTPSYDIVSHTAQNRIRIATRNPDLAPDTDLTVYQHCHSEQEIRGALHLADFHCVESFDGQEDLGIAGEYGRRFFLCR